MTHWTEAQKKSEASLRRTTGKRHEQQQNEKELKIEQDRLD